MTTRTTSNKLYRGSNDSDGGTVTVTDLNTGQTYPLNPRLDLCNHSPTGFAWGYAGSGPAQLAFALLCDAADPETARVFYQQFKEQVIARLPMADDWQLTTEQIDDTVGLLAWAHLEAKRRRREAARW